MTTTSSYPKGAEALLVALATPAPNGLLGIPVLLWGRPGVGKSSFIEGLAGEELPVTTLIASIHDPTDFSGLPILDGERVRYASPSWVDDFSEEGRGILFLDELSTAPPSVQSALLRVVFERRVGTTALPEGVRIVAAANPPDLMIGGWELSPPLRNRFVHLDWDIDADLFVEAQSSEWRQGKLPAVNPERHARKLLTYKNLIAAYLRVNPTGLHSTPEENPYGFASPRSWEFVAALLASCDLLGYPLEGDDGLVAYSLVRGCLGEATALSFTEYAATLRLPDPEAVLAGDQSPDLADFNDSELYVLFGGMNAVLARTAADDTLVGYGHTYLRLAREVFQGGRRDVIFIALRQVAQRGFLQRLVTAAAADTRRLPEIQTLVGELFGDATMREFVEVLA